MTLPLAALYSQSLGASPAMIGVVLGSGFVLPVLSAVSVGGWVDRLGASRMILFGSIGLALAPIIPVLLPNLMALGALQVVAGLSHLAAVVAIQSYVARIGGSREKNFGWYTTLVSLGQLIGPLLAGAMIEMLGYRSALIVSGCAGVLAALFGLALLSSARVSVPRTEASPRSRPQVGGTLNQPLRVALFTSGATLFALGVHQTFFPVYLDTKNVSATAIGALVGLRALSAITVRPFLARLGRLVGNRSLTLGASLLLCGLALALVPLGNSILVFGAASVLLGLGSGVSQPLTMVVLSDHVHEARRGAALGARLSVNFLALGLSTLLIGALVPSLGYATAFVICAVIPALVAAWVYQGGGRLEAPQATG
jgi:MFS family permease